MEQEEFEPMTELERRYLLTFLLTEETESEELFEELDAIAPALEEEREGAEKEFAAFESKIIDMFRDKTGYGEVENLEESTEDQLALKNRLRILYAVSVLDEDTEWTQELVDTAISLKGADSERFKEVSDQLAVMEEDIITFYFNEELEDEEMDEDQDGHHHDPDDDPDEDEDE